MQMQATGDEVQLTLDGLRDKWVPQHQRLASLHVDD